MLDREKLKQEIREANIPNLLMTGLAGSHAYGMSTPESDIDVRGIFCGSKENICTPFFPYKEQNISSMEDAKVYELSNFLHLYTQGNPNILESLWLDDSSILTQGVGYDLLHAVRSELLSKKVAFTFSGYALSQLKRIKGHKKWISNPQPLKAPMHKDYISLVQNFTEDKIMPRDFYLGNYKNYELVPYGNDLYGIVDHLVGNVFNSQGEFNIRLPRPEGVGSALKPEFIIKYNKDEFKRAKENHTNYWNWKNNRNEKRSALEEKHGYDSKHASHLVRLLRMGEEVLKGQGVIVKRPDAKELLDIRAGLLDYDCLIKWAEEKDKYIRGELYEKSLLPKSPNIKLASNTLLNIQEEVWGC